MTKIGLIQFLLLTLISAAYGQKAKYKDIFALLSSKQFEQAEPFLKQYLKETSDNPNAYLFMGNIFQDKASKTDVLKQTAIAVANMDSAIFFYDKAYKTLDDREVRKNKEYYQSYSRRDLRTGEFGVKLPDIQFDIEKRIETLKERIAKVKLLSDHFHGADNAYKRANLLYLSLQNNYPSENNLYLRANDETLDKLATLSRTFDSCVTALQQYKAVSSTLGKTGYDPRISITPIEDFKIDGRPAADFFGNEIALWDYKLFADHSMAIIEKEIQPMRKHLATYDTGIDKLRAKLDADSVSVRSDLTRLIDKVLYDRLKKYDAKPLPMLVFALKTADLEYRSMLLEHKPLRDSADIPYQISMLMDEMAILDDVDSTLASFQSLDLEDKYLDYAGFFSSFGNASVIRSYVKAMQDFSQRERARTSAVLKQYQRMLNYIVDGRDSIPLLQQTGNMFQALRTEAEKYTTGISLKDTTQLMGYFYTIAPSRKAEVKVFFPLDKSVFKKKNISVSRALTFADPAGDDYYVLVCCEKTVKNKFYSTLARISRAQGLVWKVDHPLTFMPEEVTMSSDGKSLVIRNASEQVNIDGDGKIKVN